MEGTFIPPALPSPSTGSTTSSRSSIQDLENEFQTLRDENLRYEEDFDFHRFIGVLDLVDAVVIERPAKDLRRRSITRLFGAFNKKRTEKPSIPDSIMSSD